MNFELTGPQEEALDLTRSVAVSAGAGSGKTSVLTERYVRALERLVDRPDALRRVVAITFTRRAAAEMRERVREKIDARRRERDVGTERRRFWRNILRDFHTARISTIHSFCASILRDVPFDSHLDPDVRVLDATDAELRQVETIVDVLDRLSVDRDPALARLLQHYDYRRIRELLETMMWNRDFAEQWTDALPRDWPQWESRLREDVAAANPPLLDTLRGVLAPDEWIDLAAHSRRPDDDKLVDVLRAARPLFDAIVVAGDATPDEDALVDALRAAILRKGGDARRFSVGKAAVWGEEAAEVKKRMNAISAEFAPLAARHIAVNAERDRLAHQLECSLADVYRRCTREYEDRLAREHAIDYQGLELHTARVLGRRGVAERVRTEIDYLLVDEFQDTNHLQWNIVHQLIREGDDAPNLFVVGDDKQAIYEFRGGRVEIFRTVTEDAAAIVPVHMNENFRSLSAPLTFANTVFADVLGPGGEPYEAAAAELIHARRSPETLGDGSVTLAVTSDDPAIAARQVAVWLDDALRTRSVDDGEGGIRPLRAEDVAIIAFHRRSFLPFQDALDARHIPYNVAGGRGFYQTQEVRDVVSLLDAFTDRRNDTALAAVLRSPHVNLSDEDLLRIADVRGYSWWKKLDTASAGCDADDPIRQAAGELVRWQGLCGRVPTATLLSDIWDETGYRAVLAAFPGGPRRAANLEKLVDAIRVFEEMHGINPAALARWLNARAKTVAEEGEAVEVESPDGVTILTAHNSKGTEYPLVIVTGVETEGRKDSADPVLFFHDAEHARLGLKVPDSSHADGRLEPSAPYLVLKHLREDRNRAEEKRLAYVSLTRAQDHLMIAAPPITGKPKGVLASLVAFEPLRRVFADADSGDEVLDVGGVEVAVRRTFPAGDGEIDDERPFSVFAEAHLTSRSVPVPSEGPVEEAPPIHTATDFRDLVSSPGDTLDRLRIGAWRSLGVRGRAGRKRTRTTSRRSAAELGTYVHELLSTVYVADDVAALTHIDEEALGHIRAFTESAVGRAALASGGGDTEVEFVIPFGEDIFRGAIDRVFQDHRGVWTVVDYKTDDVRDVDDVGDHVRAAGYDLQLALYALALRDCRALSPDDEVRVVLVFTQPSAAGAREIEWAWRTADLPPWSLIERAAAYVASRVLLGASGGPDEQTPLPPGTDPFGRLQAMLRPPEPPSAGVQLELY